MKKIILLLLSFLSTAVSFSQWTKISPLPDGVSMNSMQFIDNNTGWILCSDGLILKATNAGEGWELLNTGTSSYLRSISFIDSKNGWVVGNNNTVLKTTDGGNTWIPLTTGLTPNTALGKVKFFSENVGYIVGGYNTSLRGMNFSTRDNGKTWITNTKGDKSWFDTTYYNDKNELVAEIFDYTSYERLKFKSEDGGNTWVTKSEGRGKWLRQVLYKGDNETNGISVDFQNVTPVCLKTTDGGNTWIQKTAVSDYPVSFTDENTGYVLGNDGRAYKTTNSGDSWNIMYEFIDGSPLVLFFYDNNHGWIGGSRYLGSLRTTDGGNTWLSCNLPYSGDEIREIFFLNPNEGWVTGTKWDEYYSLPYYKTTDGGASFTKHYSSNFTELYSLFFTGSNSGWAIGENSKLIKTDINGDFNIYPFLGNQTDIRSVYFIDSNTGWCVAKDIENDWVGSYGNIWKTTDGGRHWNIQKEVAVDIFNKIFFYGEQNGWFAGWEGIAHTTDGGLSWVWQWSNGNEVFCDIHFVDAQTGWAVGGDGLILSTSDGGNNWLPQYSGTNQKLNSVHFINNQMGWIAGDDGSIFKTTNGGANWSSLIGSSNQLKSIFSVSPNVVYAVGSDGLILKTTNGGTDWEAKTSGISFTLNEIKFFDINNGRAVGNSGTILYTSNGGNTWVLENTGTEENFNSISLVDGNYGWAAGDHGTLLRYDNPLPVGLTSSGSIPGEFALLQNYPNPFNPATTIDYQIYQGGLITLKVYDILGNEVKTLVNEPQSIGRYTIRFDASDLASGIYIYRMQVNDFLSTKKMSLLK